MIVKSLALGRLEGGNARLLGTAFLVRQNILATAAHVLDGSDNNLIGLVPELFNNDLNSYQHHPREKLDYLSLAIADIDPLHDIALLKCIGATAINHPILPNIGTVDEIQVGSDVLSLSYPHSHLGNTIMVVQHAVVGARVFIRKGTLKVRHVVINQQTVLGQSGAPVYASKSSKLIGLLVGAFGPGTAGGISLGGIDPHTLHQTSFVVSGEYLAQML